MPPHTSVFVFVSKASKKSTLCEFHDAIFPYSCISFAEICIKYFSHFIFVRLGSSSLNVNTDETQSHSSRENAVNSVHDFLQGEVLVVTQVCCLLVTSIYRINKLAKCDTCIRRIEVHDEQSQLPYIRSWYLFIR